MPQNLVLDILAFNIHPDINTLSYQITSCRVHTNKMLQAQGYP